MQECADSWSGWALGDDLLERGTGKLLWPKLLRDEAVLVPQPCHIMRSTTVNDGSPQSRCTVHPGCRYSRNDLGNCAADHVRPYKAVVPAGTDSYPAHVCRYGMGYYKRHFVCLACRSSFKRDWPDEREQLCPRCGATMIDAGHDLAVPRRRDAAGWKVLSVVLRAGLTFHSCGCGGPGFRPRTPAEVRARRIAAVRLSASLREALQRTEVA